MFFTIPDSAHRQSRVVRSCSSATGQYAPIGDGERGMETGKTW